MSFIYVFSRRIREFTHLVGGVRVPSDGTYGTLYPGVDGWSDVLPSAIGVRRAHTKGVGVPLTWVLSAMWCDDFKRHSQNFLTHSP